MRFPCYGLAQVVGSVDGLRLGRRPKEPGRLGIAVLIRP